MAYKKPLVLSVPPDIREWVEREAGRRRMTMSEYAIRLMTRGIQAEAIDESVAKLTAVVESAGITREVLRQVLATRYIAESQAKGTIKAPATLGTDANIYADRELEKLWPKQEGDVSAAG